MARIAYSDKEKKAYRDAKESEFARLADGKYTSVLDDVEAKEIGQRLEKKLLLKHRIISPEESAGAVYTQFLSMDNLNTMGILKVVLRKFGIDPNEIELQEVEGKLCDLIGAEVSFSLETTTAKNGKDYQNMRIETVTKADGEEKAPLEVDDDIPF